ncbi:SDR family NAD(P)-dependent oxidoreductase [Haloarchaeobius amylolyticus]|uniref:SDR family NAD(P)-dependent oxidoreductase n=1 Tax=Haloarchaeobius amylolyticus TaxID=1198296 RepID=UPI00226FA5AF|nr:SDR family NAD(P)-dependent oxidoreductase [Haloarchaeobius amylolyticus]
MRDLSETVALVTGASRGVGRGIAVELGTAGATVYVTGRSVDDDTTEGVPGTVTETAELVTEAGGEGIAVACDHTDDEQVAALVDRIEDEHGRLDLLVNNVWGGYEGHDETFGFPFWKQPIDRWDRMFDAGVRAHFTTSRLVAPMMRAQQGGLIVGISAGDGEKFRGSVPYDTAKTAVDRLHQGMAYELEPDGVTSLVVYPGFTRTERVVAAFESVGDDLPESAHSPEFVGRAVVALAADEDVFTRTGGIFKVGDLAREYDFTDTDGSQPEPYDLPTDPV